MQEKFGDRGVSCKAKTIEKFLSRLQSIIQLRAHP